MRDCEFTAEQIEQTTNAYLSDFNIEVMCLAQSPETLSFKFFFKT
jgi:hypothetical protein